MGLWEASADLGQRIGRHSQFTENNDNGPNLFHNAGDTTTRGTGEGQLQVGTLNFTRTFSATTILSVIPISVP